MQQILEVAKPQIQQLIKKYKVEKLYAFGSVCTDNFSNESDVDLLVSFGDMPLLDFADNYFDFQNDLETILKRKIDLVVEKSITNPYFAKTIEKTKTPLYE